MMIENYLDKKWQEMRRGKLLFYQDEFILLNKNDEKAYIFEVRKE